MHERSSIKDQRKGKVENRESPADHPSSASETIICRVIFFAAVLILVIEVLLCLTPPISRDALIHHLAIPKLWIHTGDSSRRPGTFSATSP